MAAEWLTKLGESLKIKARYWVAAWFVLAAAILVPGRWLKVVDLETVRHDARGALVMLWLVATVFILANAGAHQIEKRKESRLDKKALDTLFGALKKLSIQEKQVLCLFIVGKTKTVPLSLTDGVVQGLVRLKILYRASDLGNGFGMMFDHNIQPWAWDHLNQHPELITEGVPKAANGGLIPYER